MGPDGIGKFNLEFDVKAGTEAVIKDATNTIKTAAVDSIVSSLLAGGAAKEQAATGARGAKGVADNAKSAAQLAQQKQICTAALNTIINMAQTGELSLTEFQNILRNQVINSITNNNVKADTLNTSQTELNERNIEILAEIEQLKGGQDSSGMDTQISSSPRPSNNGKEVNNNEGAHELENVASTSPNADRINELIGEYNVNLGLIASISSECINIQTQQVDLIAEGDGIKGQAEQEKNNISNNIQNEGRNIFQKIGDGIRKIFGKGKSEQLSHKAKGLTMASADSAAGAAKTAEASAETAGSVFSFGATAPLAAKAAAEASLFFSAALQNTSIAGVSGGNIVSLMTGQKTVGDLVAGAISDKVNETVSGAITEVATEILGEDVASYVAPELSNALKIDP